MHEQKKKDIAARTREKLANELLATPDLQNPDNLKADRLFQKVKDLNWLMGQGERSPHYRASRKPTYVKTYK